MNQVIRSNGQWEAINRALDAGPGSLTAGMYQDAVVAQVQTDTPELWPLGPIEGTSPAVYMATGAWEEWGETLERDQTNPGYHRLAKLVLPSDVSYPFDEPHAIDRHVKEFGDLSWYVANILASHHVRLADVLPGETLSATDEAAKSQALSSGRLIWHLPGHNFMFSAVSFFGALGEIGDPLLPGAVSEFFRRRDNLAKRAGQLLMSISVLAQAKFNTSLSEIFYRNIVKVEARTATNTVLHANGDEREKSVV